MGSGCASRQRIDRETIATLTSPDTAGSPTQLVGISAASLASSTSQRWVKARDA